MKSKKYKILLACSNTASNIGNDFFYLGVKHALKNVIKHAEVFDGYFSPFNAYGLSGKEKINNLDYFSDISGVDAIVIAGPVLDKYFGFQFESVLSEAKKLGKKIFILSAGGREYDTEEVDHCKSILKKYPPDVFVSRDRDTYINYSESCANSYDGICFAFFANDYYEGYETSRASENIVSCFDFAPEPNLEKVMSQFEKTNDESIKLKVHSTRSFKNKVLFTLQRGLPKTIGDIKVLRTCHRPMRKKQFIFFKPNVLSSFISGPYLNLYKNTRLTVTDRLHAAVVTLSFGNYACLLLSSNRTRLLDRAGIGACVNNIYKMPQGLLNNEKALQLAFLNDTTRLWLKNEK